MPPSNTNVLPSRGALEVSASPASRGRASLPVPAPEGSLQPDGVEQFVVRITRRGRRPRVEASGELDLATAPLLQAVVEHARRGRTVAGAGPARGTRTTVEVDLGRITFADSHGLAPALADGVTLSAVSPPVSRVLRLLHQPAAPRLPAGRAGSPAPRVSGPR